MAVGSALLDAALKGGARRLFVVGTGKNVGKTVAMRAIAAAAYDRGLKVALTSSGRDGEAIDAAGDHAKPRLFLRDGTMLATARGLVPPHPAAEVLDCTAWPTAAGDVALLRVRRAGFFELAGPASAAAMRECVHRFERWGADLVIVDGALDRVAPLAAGADAIVVSAGAGASPTPDEAVIEASALTRRLRIPQFDPNEEYVRIDGALTAARASQLAAAKERRQIVVRDATHLVASGRTLLGILDRLDVRCVKPLNVIAVTAASIGPDRYFEPAAFSHALAQATALPVYDVYAQTQVRAA